MNEEINSVCSFAAGLGFEPYGIDHLVDAFGHHRLPLDPEFPFAIKAFFYESFPPGERLTWHNRLELFCPISGSGSFQMGERIIDFKSGDLLVVDNLKLHGALSFDGPRSLAAVIYFRAELFYNLGSAVCDYAYLTPFYGLSETISPVLRAADPASGAVHEALGKMIRCYFDAPADQYSRIGCKAYLSEILYLLSKHFGASDLARAEYVRRRDQAQRLGALVDYLNTNYAEKIAVPQAAAMVGMSQSTFNRFLKQAAGMTFANISPNSFFPLAGIYVNAPLDIKPTYLQQWNLSVQRQIGEWLFAGNYLGNKSTRLWTGREANPAVFGAGATLGNTNQRRALNLLNQAQGQFYGTIGEIDDGGASSYNAMLLSAQRRLANNFSVLANYTLSHCISDPATTEITGPTYVNPNNRRADRANCDSDRRHVVNVSFVARTPQFANRALNLIASGWQLSGIVRAQSGNYSTVTTGVDNALTGVAGQRAAQLLADPYDANKTVDHYLNRAAFGAPASGTYSSLGAFTILNPGSLQIDTGLSRSFRVLEGQSIQFRWEVFNVPNRLNANAPVTALNNATFGRILSAQDPRIMQFALKYVF